MTAKLHLISGLPRSGSTLLCALLRQNPRFSASVTSPVAALWGALQQKMSGASEFSVFFDDDCRSRILRATLNGFYGSTQGKEVIFDTNRGWTGKTALVGRLYPRARIICCAREVGWIIDSIERMLAKNPLQTSRIFNFKPGDSVYVRAQTLMHSDNGLIGLAWSTFREAWFGEQAKRLIVVTYDSLVSDPAQTLQRLYQELGEAPFTHDFENVSYEEPEYDAQLGMPGLHTVRPKVEYEKRKTCLPPDLFAKYADVNFWVKPELNHRGVLVL